MNQELENYIKQERSVGANDEVIKQKLRAGGWTDKMFNGYFANNNTNQPKPYLQEYSQETVKHSKLMFIIIACVIILAVGAYFAFAQTNWFITEEIQPEDNEGVVVVVEDVDLEEEEKLVEEQLPDDKKNGLTYDSPYLDITIEYPNDFFIHKEIGLSANTADEDKAVYFVNDKNEDHYNAIYIMQQGSSLEEEGTNNLEKLSVLLESQYKDMDDDLNINGYGIEKNISINENLFMYSYLYSDVPLLAYSYVDDYFIYGRLFIQTYYTMVNDKTYALMFQVSISEDNLEEIEAQKDFARSVVDTLKFK